MRYEFPSLHLRVQFYIFAPGREQKEQLISISLSRRCDFFIFIVNWLEVFCGSNENNDGLIFFPKFGLPFIH